MPAQSRLMLTCGAIAGLAIAAMLIGTQPLYEAKAIVAAPAPALLAEYARATATAATASQVDDALGLDDIGDLAETVEHARVQRAPQGGDIAVEAELDPDLSEVGITVQTTGPRDASAVANDVATSVVGARDATVATQLTEARAELTLFTALARRTRAVRGEVAALRTRIASLTELSGVPGAGLVVLRKAQVPRRAVGPHRTRDIVVGALLAMLAAASLRRPANRVRDRARHLRASPASVAS